MKLKFSAVNVEKGLNAVLFLLVVFFASVIINFLRQMNKDFELKKFWRKYVLAHGMACLFSMIFLCTINTWVLDIIGERIMALVGVVGNVWFSVKIIITQNEESGGYIENLDDASGLIMYMTAILSPEIFAVGYLIGWMIFYYLSKKSEEDSTVWKNRSFKCFLEFVEALLATVIVNNMIPKNIIDTIWLNAIMISVFTLIMPFMNDKIYSIREKKMNPPSDHSDWDMFS